MRPGGCTSRRIESAVTDLPLPDSPTRPSVSPRATSKLTSIDGRHERPADVEAGRQVLDRQERVAVVVTAFRDGSGPRISVS